MQPRFSPIHLILFIFALGMLLAFIQVGLLTIAFEKLGVSRESAFLLLFSSLFGSLLNLPLFTIRAEAPMQPMPHNIWRLLRQNHLVFEGKTTIAVNVGGCLIPLVFCLYLITAKSLNPLHLIMGISVVSIASYFSSRPIHGLGIGMPILVAPLCAAIVAVILDAGNSAPLAYISGTMGVLIGADILHLKDIRKMGTPIASIGGAGTFDGIFITGIVAVLLA